MVPREEGRLCVALVDDHGADLVCAVAGREFGGQALVEGVGGGLGGGVVDHARDGDPGGHGCDGDDHAVVVLAHVGEELLGGPVVGEGVDVEGEADVALGGVEDRLADDDAGVVDEDGGVADLGADFGRHRGDGLGGGDVALEVVDVGGGREGQGLDVEDHDGDAALREELDDVAADAAGATGDEDDLLGPVVLVGSPVVHDFVGEPVVEQPERADGQESLEPVEGRGVEDREVLAALGEARQKDEREDQPWVEGCVADDLENRVHLEALAGEEAIVHRHLGCRFTRLWVYLVYDWYV